MDWLEKLENIFIINDYREKLLHFLINHECISGDCNLETWKKLFQRIDQWKEQYLIKSENITLYGVDGWYMDLYMSEFACSDNVKENLEIYLCIIMLIAWRQSFYDFDPADNKYYENTNLIDGFKEDFDYSKERCKELNREALIGELEDRYIRSYDKFQFYKKEKGKNNPKVVTNLEMQYPKCLNYINFLKDTLKECSAVRINGFGHDEDVWYFIKSKEKMYIILIQDFV